MIKGLLDQIKNAPAWQRLAILVAIPILLILYFWTMLLSPALDEKSKLERDVENTKAELERLRLSISPRILENLREQRDKLKEEYSQKYTELTSLVGEIPTEKDVGKILKNIGALAQKNRVVVVNMQVSNPQKVQYYLDEQKKLVKEMKTPQQREQTKEEQAKQLQKEQEKQQTLEGVSFIRTEAKLTLLGNYSAIKGFLNDLRQRGIISYPVEIDLSNEGKKVRANLTLHLLLREEAEQ